MNEPDWEARRARMVQGQLRPRGIDDPRLLDALSRVPRDRFVPPSSRERAYADQALPIAHGQTISQPFMVAVMTQALSLGGTERVLEVGTGSGYQAAILAELAGQVWTVERIPALAEEARRLLRELGYTNVEVRAGDGTMGWADHAPYDAILVTAAAPRTPDPLLEQLSPDGGILVAPVGDQDLQQLMVIQRHGTSYETRRSIGCRFVPLIGEHAWAGR